MGANARQYAGEIMMAAAEGRDKAPAIKRECIIRFPFGEKRFQEGGLSPEADHAIHRETAQGIAFANWFKSHHGLQRKPRRDVKAGGDFAEQIKAGAAPRGILGVEGGNAIKPKISFAGDMGREALRLGAAGKKAGYGAKDKMAKTEGCHAASPRIAGTIRDTLCPNIAS
jgi:hypothetical protein